MASVRTQGKPDWWFDELPEDEDQGCACRSGEKAMNIINDPKGDPLTQLLALEQRAFEEGFEDVHEYINYLNYLKSIGR